MSPVAADDLQLEIKEDIHPDAEWGSMRVMMTPAIGEDYWMFRVKVSDTQAIIGFGKFGTIGIGFAVEDDWNTNLPYSSPTIDIYNHIAHNKGDDTIPPSTCLKAIRMVQEAAARYKHTELPDTGFGRT